VRWLADEAALKRLRSHSVERDLELVVFELAHDGAFAELRMHDAYGRAGRRRMVVDDSYDAFVARVAACGSESIQPSLRRRIALREPLAEHLGELVERLAVFETAKSVS